MPAFANGLNLAKPKPSLDARLAGQKRKKTLFDDDSDAEDTGVPETDAISTLGGLSKPASAGKSTKGSSTAKPGAQPPPPRGYTNLSALHDAKKHAAEAEKIDASIYDYDNAYDTFSTTSKAKNTSSANAASSGPKYMTTLLSSAEVRKRDQLRAKERLLQKEREAEGDEFADHEKFVTGAYKQQQEELRRMEEEEAKPEAEEEERRKKGGGMRGFYEGILKREEQRQTEIEKAVEEKATRGPTEKTEDEDSKEKSDAQIAAELNKRGAHIAINDEGAVVDKRDLLSAGLNVAKKPKPTDASKEGKRISIAEKPGDWFRSNAANSARENQRERQTRMMAAQLEEMQQKQAQEEETERQEAEKKVASKVTEDKVMGAKERYLARKKEKEEESKKAKSGG